MEVILIAYKCKVTFLKREFFSESAEEYVKSSDLENGQEFIIGFDEYCKLPVRFCGEAWDAINCYIYVHLNDGTIMAA